MPVMSRAEAAFCRSGPWQASTAKVVMPWVLHGEDLAGDVLEIGAGANTAVLAAAHPDATITVTDLDPAMVAAARTA